MTTEHERERIEGALSAILANLETLHDEISRRWDEFETQVLALVSKVGDATPDAWRALGAELDRILGAFPAAKRIAEGAARAHPRPDVLLGHDDPRGPRRGSGVPRDWLASYERAFDGARRSHPASQPGVTPPPPLAPLLRYPYVHGPTRVRTGADFDIEVALRAKQWILGGVAIPFTPSGTGSIEVQVVLEVSDEGRVRFMSAHEATLKVPEDALDSARAVFTLRATHEGAVTLVARFVQGGVTRGVASHVLEVVREASESAVVTSGASASLWISSGAPPEVLTLDVRGLDGEDPTLRVELRGPVSKLPRTVTAAPRRVKGDALKMLQALCRDIDKAFETLTTAGARRNRLLNLGGELAQKLVPDELRRTLGAMPEGTRLHIETEEAWIPWEMLVLGGDDFAGRRFALTRWLRSVSPWSELRGGEAVLVAGTKPSLVLNTDRELDALMDLAGTDPALVHRVEDVQDRLRTRRPVGFFHVATHGLAPAQDPLGGVLLLDDGELRPVDLHALEARDGALWGSAVFLNACEAAGPVRQVSGHRSWVQKVLEQGAALCVAPVWAVYDRNAGPFAAAFYKALGRGLEAGEAGRQARLALGDDGLPDTVAYGVYTSPTLALQRRKGA